MKLIIEMSDELYAQLSKVGNGSIASKWILKDVREGIPFTKVMDDIKTEIKSKMFEGYANDNGSADLPDHQAHFNSGLILALEIIDKHTSGKEKE